MNHSVYEANRERWTKKHPLITAVHISHLCLHINIYSYYSIPCTFNILGKVGNGFLQFSQALYLKGGFCFSLCIGHSLSCLMLIGYKQLHVQPARKLLIYEQITHCYTTINTFTFAHIQSKTESVNI